MKLGVIGSLLAVALVLAGCGSEEESTAPRAGSSTSGADGRASKDDARCEETTCKYASEMCVAMGSETSCHPRPVPNESCSDPCRCLHTTDWPGKAECIGGGLWMCTPKFGSIVVDCL